MLLSFTAEIPPLASALEAIVSAVATHRPVISSALVAITLALIAQPILGAQPSQAKVKFVKKVVIKRAGRTTTSVVVNTLRNGIGAPSATLGKNGDFYIDTVSMNLYGPKSKNAWPLPKSLVGPAGVAGAIGKAGANGKDGTNGKDGRDGSNGRDGDRGPAGISTGGAGDVGPAGPAGPIGATGPAGPAGAQGSAGVAGAAGPAGATGATGPAGATGAQGEIGPRGLQGLQGATGAAGTTGAQGLQGIQGETGPAGPSRIIHGNTLPLTLSTSTPGTGITSEPIISYQSNKKYSFMIRQYGGIASTQKTKTFGMDVFATNVSNLKYTVLVTEAYSIRSGVSVHEYIFEAIGTFSTSNNLGDLSFSITDGAGISGTYPMTLSGVYQLNEVGELTRIDQTSPVTAIS